MSSGWEDAHLGELGHPGEQHELQVGIRPLEDRVEGFQHIPLTVFQQAFLPIQGGLQSGVQHIQYRLVVLVHQNDATATVFQVGLVQNVCEPESHVLEVRAFSVYPFPGGHVAFQHVLQRPGHLEVLAVEVDMEHGVFEPVLLQSLYHQSLEQFLLALEVVLERGDQEALAETTGTA